MKTKRVLEELAKAIQEALATIYEVDDSDGKEVTVRKFVLIDSKGKRRLYKQRRRRD